MKLSISFYDSSATCDNAPKEITEYNLSNVIKDSGNHAVRLVTAQDLVSNTYFQLMISKTSVIIESSQTLPIEYSLDNSLSLKRVEQLTIHD